MNLNMEIELVGHSTGAYAVAALLNFDNLGVSKSKMCIRDRHRPSKSLLQIQAITASIVRQN